MRLQRRSWVPVPPIVQLMIDPDVGEALNLAPQDPLQLSLAVSWLVLHGELHIALVSAALLLLLPFALREWPSPCPLVSGPLASGLVLLLSGCRQVSKWRL